jgi:protein-disulfide isomerase
MRKTLQTLVFLVAATGWVVAAAAAPANAPISIMKLMAPGPLPDMALGKPDAPVTIVEYASMTCPHCANFDKTVFDTLKKDYIDTGKVYYVFREFPLDDLAFAAAMAARCAPKDKYFPIIDTLFRNQDSWAYVDKPGPALVAELQPFGFTQDSFAACLNDKKIADGIKTISDTGQKEFGIDATPTFFINGEKHVGEMNVAETQAILDPLVAQAKK